MLVYYFGVRVVVSGVGRRYAGSIGFIVGIVFRGSRLGYLGSLAGCRVGSRSRGRSRCGFRWSGWKRK